MLSVLRRCAVRASVGCLQPRANVAMDERSIFLVLFMLLAGFMFFAYRWNHVIVDDLMAEFGEEHGGLAVSMASDDMAEEWVDDSKPVSHHRDKVQAVNSTQKDDSPSITNPQTTPTTTTTASPKKGEIKTEFWKYRELPRDLQGASQDNPRLIREIRDYWIVPPSRWHTNLESPKQSDYSQHSQSKVIASVLQKNGGFFVECGAADGELYSNTLFFEKAKNWTGLLIEPDAQYFQALLKKNRNAYIINACVSPESRALFLNFTSAQLAGGLTEYMEEAHLNFIEEHEPQFTFSEVQCFPLYSILMAIGASYVDFLSLDVEGPELHILHTFPFHEVVIDVLMVEYGDNKHRLDSIRRIMDGTGLYDEVERIADLDIVFKRKGLPSKAKEPDIPEKAIPSEPKNLEIPDDMFSSEPIIPEKDSPSEPKVQGKPKRPRIKPPTIIYSSKKQKSGKEAQEET